MLSKEVKTGKTVHAYLFVGPRGTGKTTTARVLAKALNCIKLNENGDPCDRCVPCVSIREGNYPDLIEIDAASNRGIDDIRDLRDKVRLAPSRGKRKIYIIDEVHMLTSEAFNALLKTLEEPPKNVTFILCTTESHKVPETIKSRCQVFKFKRATTGQIVARLQNIAKKEKFKINEDSLKKIASASSGGFRDAENFLQQVSEGDLNIEALLSISSKETYIEFVGYLLDKDTPKAINIINKVFEEGIDLYLWTGELLKYLRELLFIKSGSLSLLEELTEEVLAEVKKQAKGVELPWLVDVIRQLLETQKETRSSSISQLPLELFIVGVCADGEKQSDSQDEEEEEDGEEGKAKVGERVSPVPPKLALKAILEQEKKAKVGHVSQVATKKLPVSKKNLITVEKLDEKWKEFLKQSKELNHSINALLKSGKALSIEGNSIIFEVFFPFHKERLESPKSRKMVEELLEEVYGIPLKVRCVLSKEKKPVKEELKKGESGLLTDYNLGLLDVFDGGLPAVR